MNAPTLLRPLGFGEVLDSAFTLYRRNFGTFVKVALLPTTAMLAAALLAGFPSGGDFAAFGGLLLFIGAAFIGTLAMWNALTHLSSQAYGGLPVSVREGYRVGMGRFLPALGAMILVLLILIVAFVGIAMVVGIAGAIFAGGAFAAGGGGEALAVVLGLGFGLGAFVLYAVAGAYFFALLPAVVIERKGPGAAIARSVQLAGGAVWRLVGLILVCLVIVYLPVLGVVVLTGTFSTLYDPAAAAAAQGSTAFLLQQSLTMASGALTTPFFVAVLVVQYYDRRVRTEALDVQAAADRLAMA